MRIRIPPKEPIKEPEIRWQKELNCWQIANQFALVFPLCARYTMAAAAEAADVKSPSIAYHHCVKIHFSSISWKSKCYGDMRKNRLENTVSKKIKIILVKCA